MSFDPVRILAGETIVLPVEVNIGVLTSADYKKFSVNVVSEIP